ncbi:MAG: intradiol ring-cleavage dioxygenase [Ignavibacteriales bacterium]|nr:intradiol ring-cleavage dioxygenase [Ignavibacteriales bacterium]
MNLQTLFLSTILLPLVVAGKILAQETPPLPERPKTITSSVTLVSQKEPGEQLIVNGVFYSRDGKTPAPGVLLYVYQTDATGVYNSDDGSWQRPRINGWFRTDKDGRYEIRTIKPGSYPRGRNPAHIHLVIVPDNGAARWLDDFLFEGDPFLSPAGRERPSRDGRFSYVMKIRKGKDGLLHCERDIILDTR